MQNLTLIIPTKKEAESLPTFLREIKNIDCHKMVVLQKEDIETKNALRNFHGIEIFEQINNGYGNALIEGINNSKTKLVSFNEKEIPIEVFSNHGISKIECVYGGSQFLSFNVDNLDQLIVLKIPLELLLNPFNVYFTEKEDTSLDQLDKIRKTEFKQDKTHVSVVFRTSSEGVVSITGASVEEHERILDQIKKRTQGEIKSEIIEEKKSGVAIPIPGSGQPTNNPSETMISEKEELSFKDELSKGQTTEYSQDYTIIAIIIGVIAAIIIGVIVKVKKN